MSIEPTEEEYKESKKEEIREDSLKYLEEEEETIIPTINTNKGYILILARFIGKRSLGYENGLMYRLKVEMHKGMSIQKFDGSSKCPYESISAFLRNWTDIKHIENG